MLFVGVLLARAPAADIFLAYKNSVNFVPRSVLGSSTPAVLNGNNNLISEAPLLSVVFIDQTNF